MLNEDFLWKYEQGLSELDLLKILGVISNLQYKLKNGAKSIYELEENDDSIIVFNPNDNFKTDEDEDDEYQIVADICVDSLHNDIISYFSDKLDALVTVSIDEDGEAYCVNIYFEKYCIFIYKNFWDVQEKE